MNRTEFNLNFDIHRQAIHHPFEHYTSLMFWEWIYYEQNDNEPD